MKHAGKGKPMESKAKHSVRYGAFFVASFVFSLTMSGCGKDEPAAPEPPAPCQSGLNINSCALELEGRSRWVSQRVERLPGDAFLGIEPGRMVERMTTQIKDFEAVRGEAGRWTRFITIQDRVVRATDQENEQMKSRLSESQPVRVEYFSIPRTMVIGGRVYSIDDQSISLSLDRSTCDGVRKGVTVAPANPQTLYYTRSGDHVRFSTRKPIQMSQAAGRGLMETIAEIAIVLPISGMLEATGAMFVRMIVQMLTLGRYRNELEAVEGEYIRPNIQLMIEEQFTFGQVGCFDGVGASSQFLLKR